MMEHEVVEPCPTYMMEHEVVELCVEGVGEGGQGNADARAQRTNICWENLKQ